MRLKPYWKYDPRRLQPATWLMCKVVRGRHGRMHTAIVLCAHRHPDTRIPGLDSYCGECAEIVRDWKFR